MYLPVVICLCIFSQIHARRLSQDALIPLNRFSAAAATARAHGFTAADGIHRGGHKIVTYVHPEAAAAMGLSRWPCDAYLERQQLYESCLKRVVTSSSLRDLVATTETSLTELRNALKLFFRVPIYYVLLHQEVQGFASTFYDLLQKKCQDCMLYDDVRLLDASHRSKRVHKLMLQALESVHRDVQDFLRRLKLPLSTLNTMHVVNKAVKDMEYWSRVHSRSYINGVGIAVKMAALTIVNRLILPIVLKNICVALAKYIKFVDLSSLHHLVSLNLQ